MSNFSFFLAFTIVGILVIKFSSTIANHMISMDPPYLIKKLGVDKKYPLSNFESFFRYSIIFSGCLAILLGFLALIVQYL